MVLHIIDACIRWSATEIIRSKTCADILPAIVRAWFRLYGPPKVIVTDQEGALMSEEASVFFERWGFRYDPRRRGPTPIYVSDITSCSGASFML